jgi:hypothetical protein
LLLGSLSSENLAYGISYLDLYVFKAGWLSFEWFKAAKCRHSRDFMKQIFASPFDVHLTFPLCF